MKNKNLIKTLLIALVLLVVMAGASVVYNRYQDEALRAQQQAAVLATPVPTETPAVQNTEVQTPQPTQPLPTEEPEAAYTYAPDFKMVDIDGNEVALSDYFGKPMVLNFWASWCTYCTKEMPDIAAAYEKHQDDIAFILVNCMEQREDALDYIESNGYTMPVFFDDVGMQGQLAYYVRGLPYTAFITSDGILFALHPGYLNTEVLDLYLADLLEYEANK